MIGSHAVYIRSKDGSIYKKVDDYVTLHMLMTLNDVGSWNITSTAKEKCPFSAGDGIIDIRNGAFLYGGVVTQISDKFDAVTGLYNWSVQGKGDLEYLNRRLCYPRSQSAYYIESGYLFPLSMKDSTCLVLFCQTYFLNQASKTLHRSFLVSSSISIS